MKAIHRQHHIRVTRWPLRSRSIWTEPGAVHRGKPPEHQLCFYPLAYSEYFMIFSRIFYFVHCDSKKSRYICRVKSQRLTHPKGFSFVKSAEKGFECGLTPYRTATVSTELSSLNRPVERSSAAFVVIVISIYCIFKKSRYICCTIRL